MSKEKIIIKNTVDGNIKQNVEEEIIKMMDKPCDHYRAYVEKVCVKIIKKIDDAIKSGFKFSSNFLNIFFNYILKNKGSYASCIKDLYQNVSIITELLKYIVVDPIILNDVITYSSQLMIKYFITHGVIIPFSTIKLLHSEVLDDILVDWMSSTTTQPSIEILHLLCEKGMFQYIGIFADTYKVLPDEFCMNFAILKKNQQAVQQMCALGTQFDLQCLISACDVKQVQLIKMILDSGITPTTQCLYKAVTNIYDQKMCSEIVNLLTSYKLNIVKDDVIYVIKYAPNAIYIPDIDRFGIVCDEDIKRACIEKGKFVYKEAQNIDALRKACGKAGNMTWIKKIMDDGIKPDIICLQNACTMRNNIQVIKLLCKHVTPDTQCIKNMANAIGYRQLTYIVDEYIKSVNILQSDDNKKDNKKNKKDNNIKIKKELHDDGDEYVTDEENDEDNDKIYGDNEDNNKDDKTEKPKLVVEEKKKIYTVIEFDVKNTANIDRQKKLQTLIPNVGKLFGTKSIKSSFLTMRKLVIAYIDKEKLCDKDDPKYVKPNNEMIKVFSLDASKYIKFEDINELVALCFVKNI